MGGEFDKLKLKVPWAKSGYAGISVTLGWRLQDNSLAAHGTYDHTFLAAFQGQQHSHLCPAGISLLALLFSGLFFSLATTLLWPLLFPGLFFPLATTLLWPLFFSGHYPSLATTLLWPLLFSGPFSSLDSSFLWPLVFSGYYTSQPPRAQ